MFMICSNIKLIAQEESIELALQAIHERNQRDLGMDLYRKLEIPADAAKYDASCASSGTEQRDSSDGKGLGSTASARERETGGAVSAAGEATGIRVLNETVIASEAKQSMPPRAETWIASSPRSSQ
jgi:hypothetical protein